jgi:hypothetical protein
MPFGNVLTNDIGKWVCESSYGELLGLVTCDSIGSWCAAVPSASHIADAVIFLCCCICCPVIPRILPIKCASLDAVPLFRPYDTSSFSYVIAAVQQGQSAPVEGWNLDVTVCNSWVAL